MKRIPQVLTVSALLLASASALAQEPAAVPQTATAPAQSDVSTLNGELVEVGDKNRYLYSYKRWNASTNPIGWMLGSYGASLSYAPTSIVALRGDVNYYNFDGDSGFELGLGAPIYFRKMYSGFFLEPGLTFKAISVDLGDGPSEDTTVIGPQMSAGWHWYWDSGLNVQLSVGVGRNWNNDEGEAFGDYDDVFGTAALRFGYAF